MWKDSASADWCSSVGWRRVDSYWRPLVEQVGSVKGARIGDPSTPCFRYGRFEIDMLIGCGGMGIVFKARDPELDRDVALKLWNLGGEHAEAALANEARCQARIAHPNVVTIYETGKIGPDVYLAMEYVQGTDARRWMNNNRGSWKDALAVFICAGQGLAAVHARGLVHADFKPENLLIGDDGRVLVADFGVARALRECELGAGEDAGLGTKVYMAPERLERLGGDARSDQFSFCVSLWECMYGARPFSGGTRAELLASMHSRELRTGARLPGVPRQLRKILIAGLAMDPARRFASVEELLRALRHLLVARIRRARVTVACVGLLGAGVLGASLGQVERSGRRPALERVIPHISDGITTRITATNQRVEETEFLSDAEIVERIAGFSEAMTAWRRRQSITFIKGESSEPMSREVAQAYLANAERLEATQAATAQVLARNAEQIAACMLADPYATQEGLILAYEISVKAGDILERLKPVLDPHRPQPWDLLVPTSE